jgi:hypothetical protein
MKPGNASSQLAVMFVMGPYVGAIDSAWVDRIVPGDALVATDAERLYRFGPRILPGYQVDLLLGLPKESVSWLLATALLQGRDTPITFALAIGSCLAVRRLPTTTSLPSELFRSRPGALREIFEVERSGSAVPGFVLDLPCLLEGQPSADWQRAERAMLSERAGVVRDA